MKTTKHFLTAILLLLVAFSYGQDYAYVNADSGLTVRERPDIGAAKLGKLMYNEAVEVVEKTNKKLVVLDQGTKVSGEWVKIKMNGYQDLKGYVFNGFLSENKMAKIVNIKCPKADIHIKNLVIYNDDEPLHLDEEDALTIAIHSKNIPGKKTIEIKNNDYKSVKILQSYQNSISIVDAVESCDLIEWKQYNSDWKPLKKINKSKFITLSYNATDNKKFDPVNIEELRKIVNEKCGENWLKKISTIEDINQSPFKVSTSRVFLKFIFTDINDNVSEKTIEFIVPEISK